MNTDFHRLWAAQAVSAFGARITREGLPIMAVIALGAQAATLGLLAAAASGAAWSPRSPLDRSSTAPAGGRC